ncbi:MAG: RluA family pseudouridine synthase [Erysipelotrichales bacterium]|nr:RluA family pseudouridine synthase [Erysipelotrichales bacterium]
MQYKVHYPYITFTIHSPISIQDFFKQFHLSRKTIHLLKQNKDYRVNKRFVSENTILLKGDQFTVKAFQKDDEMYPPLFDDLDIIYEDELILVVNKPPFINVYPDDPTKVNSLSNIVSGYYHMQGYHIPVRYIHRLDYETSGLVLFCKCAFIQPLLDYQLSTKDIHREYYAIVEGKINDKKEHDIDKPIARDRHHNQKMRISSTGKNAHTTYKAIQTKKNLTLIKCVLHTGRKHQIRVHMASHNYPLLGDKLYNKPSSLINRQALHAYKLQFEHPFTKEKITLICHLPQDMKNIIDPHL